VESFNGKLGNELLNGEVFNTLAEAKMLIEQWRVHYNTARPHSSLDYRPPAPEVIIPQVPAPPTGPGPTGSAQTYRMTIH
jgi:putative transposase